MDEMTDLPELANGCVMMSRARKLAAWVGAGRPVTANGTGAAAAPDE
ncbi:MULTISPECIES: hypothetical protein [Protofrankia]|nr:MULTISPECIES: hypothetical protein [Protofrankia]